MKKRFMACVLTAAMLAVSLVGCSAPASEPVTQAETKAETQAETKAETQAETKETTAAPTEAPAGEKFKVGVLAPAVTHGWVAAVAYNAELRCKELSDKIDYKLYTSANAEEMTTQLDDLKTWGAQAIVAFPQWEGMEVPIQAAIDAGIEVVNFDIEIATEGVYRVSGDNEDMGVQGAKYIVDKIGTAGTVVVMNVPSSGSVSELREKGFMDTIKEIAPDMEIITYASAFTREDGLKDMSDILTANQKIDAVYSMDDETSIGALQAIAEAGRTDVKVVTGGGGSQEYFSMMTENQDIWIESALYSPVMVKDAVDMAVAILNGETVDQVKIIPTTIVDRDNCGDYLDTESPY